jgi:hypothetical protein
LELSLTAADDLQQERARMHQLRRQESECAGYEAERARRQYDAVEPENRLVARELERRWEGSLKEQQRLAEEYARFCRSQPEKVSAAERELIRSLAQDPPALWQAPGTTAANRQRIVPLLVEEVVVGVRGDSERVDVTIRWAGGECSRHELVRPVQRYEQLAEYGRLVSRIEELREGGLSRAGIAARLNAEKFRPPKRCAAFNAGIVTRLLAKGGRSGPRPRSLAGGELPRAHEGLLSDLARQLGMPQATLHRWIRFGWVDARKLPTPGGQWAIWADAGELERLTRLRNCPRGWSEEKILDELKKPRGRDQK